MLSGNRFLTENARLDNSPIPTKPEEMTGAKTKANIVHITEL